MKIVVPQSPGDFEIYFNLRYEALRKPWNQPFSSVKDDLEDNSFHAMLLDEQGLAAGVCRMHFNPTGEAQLRFMAIRADLQGKGLGKLLLDYFENLALEKGKDRIVLQSRENAVRFYERNGYHVKEKSYLMWGIIQHYLMEKKLGS
jgi:ribosomal protein S18 acetylase RimI-like enzyme